MNLDLINQELDTRKVESLDVDSVADAPIVDLYCPVSESHWLVADGSLCGVCGSLT